MKKLVIGCGVVVIVLAVAGGAGVWYLASKARGYFQQFQALADVDKEIANTAAFTPPATGELTPDMVQRFASVQDTMHRRLGERVREITAKQDEFVRRMQAENRKDSTPMEALTVAKDMMGLILEAKKAQVDALNDQRFSLDEYYWVRGRIYTAAGVHATELSLRNLQEAIKEGKSLTQEIDVSGDVPQRNKDLVAPLLPRFKEWAPLAFIGM